jgi:beta-glucosidase
VGSAEVGNGATASTHEQWTTAALVVVALVSLTNTGGTPGTDIVPGYVSQPYRDVVVPPRRLVGFARVELMPGQSKVVHVTFPTSALAVTPGDMASTSPPEVDPGAYQLVLDKNWTTPYDVALSAPFTIS